jgi:hypothetical protein
VEVSKTDELDSAFDALKDRDALLVPWDFLLYSLRKRIVEFAAQRRLPAVYEYRVTLSKARTTSIAPRARR